MASFRKTPSGWRVEIYVKGTRDSGSFDTKAEAQAWAAKREDQLRSITGGTGSKTHTVGDVLKEYRDKVSPTKKGEKWETLRLNLIGTKKIDGVEFSRMRLADLKPAHIAAWRDARLREISPTTKKNISTATVSREMSLLSHAFEIARKEWGWLVTDPMKDIKRPPDGPPRDRLIPQSEIDAILLAHGYQEGALVVSPMQRVAVAFLFALETAMRSGEILGLTSFTVDLRQRVAHLPFTKNGSARDVPLSTRAIELLAMLPKVPDGQPLFDLTDKSRDALFRKARDRSGAPEVTFHDTRHEAITRLAKKLQVLDLARMTGHKNLNELMTYYNETAADIAARLG